METNNAVSANASRETFWSLLHGKGYSICIPEIQRDYAQGREEPEATQIRQAFLKDIFHSLESKEKLDINFIYGNLEVMGDIKKFVPIDGQQRLTTLFLLHWYLAAWAGKLTEEVKQALCRFQYETRLTTGDFCSRLVNDVDIHLKELPKEKDALKQAVKDYYWFFSSYERNASIRAMLVMLQEIHDLASDSRYTDAVDGFFDTLISDNAPISFLFLNIEDIGLTDEIYIKMNARGKALTRFENFKAQLSAYIAKTDVPFSAEFIGNINGVWSQFFWNRDYRTEAASNAVAFDDQIMILFRFMMFNEYITRVRMADRSDTKYQVRRILQEIMAESDSLFVSHLFTDEFRNAAGYQTEEANVDIAVFRFLGKLLNVLALRKEQTGELKFADFSDIGIVYFDEEKFFKRLIRATTEKDLAYDDRVLIYAEFCFLVKYANEDNTFDKSKELADWLRYVYNLSRNTFYYQADDYFRSIRGVRRIVDSGDALKIHEHAARLSRKSYKKGYGFYDNQVMEESTKAVLMLKSEAWKRLIHDAEKSFLKSQIACLLSFSGITALYEAEMSEFEKRHPEEPCLPAADYLLKTVKDNGDEQTNLRIYLDKMNLIFDENELRPEMEEDSLFRRALLCFGGGDSYLLPMGKTTVQSFLDCTDRERSFHRLLRDDNEGKRAFFKQLLDKLDKDTDIAAQLKDIIRNAAFNGDGIWKKYFVEMPEILECMNRKKGKEDPSGRFVFLDTKRYISMHDKDRILLLEKTMTTSTNREYYSYVLYLKAVKSGCPVSYFTTYNENTEKYAYYTNDQGKEVQVVYQPNDKDGNRYAFLARCEGIILYRGDMEKMLDYVKQNIG